ncbi:MAG: zinc metallopeptidase [Firmicutes bacterium]|nr:zinc metallopeptidase [Bacillota bacterium]
MFYGIDYYYIVLVLPAVLIALFAQVKVKSAYSKYSRIGNSRGITGAQAARMILDSHGLQHVQIAAIPGEMTDNFNPRTNIVSLSQGVYNGTSIASIGIAAHEVGHAIQHSENYVPNKIRSALVPVTNFGSSISIFMILLGLVLGFSVLAYLGVILYSTAALFQLVTLPVEFNASSRAMKHIREMGIANEADAKGVRKVLSAAAMTYVAALLTSVAQLVRLLLIVNRRSDRD